MTDSPPRTEPRCGTSGAPNAAVCAVPLPTEQPSLAAFPQCLLAQCQPPQQGIATAAAATSSAARAALRQASGDCIAPFVKKLFELVSDPATQKLICWSDDHARQAFVVWDPVEFSAMLLPRFFKHSNFCSFVRQLNLYGFHKIDSRCGFVFQHKLFREDAPELLPGIQRRKAQTKKQQQQQTSSQPEAVQAVPQDRTSAAPQQQEQPAQQPPREQEQAVREVLASVQQRALAPTTNPQLYACLRDEIAKLQKQNTDTQETILQLKSVLLQSRAREERL